VIFAIDRAGVVGPDGPTHAGSFDLSFMRCLPNMVIMAPANENETRQMLYTAWTLDCPTAVRYPRGNGPGVAVEKEMTALPVGKADTVRNGQKIAILNFGALLDQAEPVADALDASLVNMRFVKPLDTALLEKIANSHQLIVTIEDNAVTGGAGSAVNEYLASAGHTVELLNLGLPDVYLEHGSREQLLEEAGLNADLIQKSIEARLTQSSKRATPLRHSGRSAAKIRNLPLLKRFRINAAHFPE
jgi:1-deoxy-D-xylulose-5-phosphate synthase